MRPDVFGFYGTQWRRWPGSGVVQASNIEAATPVRPRRSAVPGPLEESLETAADPGSPTTAAATPETFVPPAESAVLPPPAGRRQGKEPAADEPQVKADEAGDAAETPPPPRRSEIKSPVPQQPQPADPPANVPADSAVEPRGEAPEQPAERPQPPADGQPQPKGPPSAGENLFNLDEQPQSTPWRSFTAAARQAARAKR